VAARRYRAPDAALVRIAILDDLTALYHRPSGTTHLVASPAPELMQAAGRDWSTAEEIHARLASAYHLADDDIAALTARLEELVEAALLETA